MSNYLVFKSTTRFYDDLNFPHGIDRSGIFTRSEVEILQGCGRILKALHEGRQPPIGFDQERFVRVCRGDDEPESSVEKAWIKYLTVISTRKAPISFYAEVGSTEIGGDGLDETDLS